MFSKDFQWTWRLSSLQTTFASWRVLRAAYAFALWIHSLNNSKHCSQFDLCFSAKSISAWRWNHDQWWIVSEPLYRVPLIRYQWNWTELRAAAVITCLSGPHGTVLFESRLQLHCCLHHVRQCDSCGCYYGYYYWPTWLRSSLKWVLGKLILLGCFGKTQTFSVYIHKTTHP